MVQTGVSPFFQQPHMEVTGEAANAEEAIVTLIMNAGKAERYHHQPMARNENDDWPQISLLMT